MTEIRLCNGQITTVDDEFSFLQEKKWYLSHNGYAVRRFRIKGERKMGVERIHRIVNATPDEMLTDHINGNRLDNRKANLRTVTPHENMLNRKLNHNNATGFSGITITPENTWRVRIQYKRKKYNIGCYQTKSEAISELFKAKGRICV